MRFALAAFSVTALAAVAGCGSGGSTSPEAAFSVQMVQTNPECMIADNLGTLGSVSSSNIGMAVTDGMTDSKMNVAMVSCTVSGTGSGPYSVQAQVTDGAYVLQITIPKISTSATLASPAPGTVSYESADTADEAYAGDCSYYFELGSGAMGSVPITAGRVWTAFQCPSLVSGMSTCPITQGYAVFEDCLTTPEM